MTLKQKILLLGSVAILGICFALWQQYTGHVSQLRAVEAISRNIDYIRELSATAHELQKERGKTTIALYGSDIHGAIKQRVATDTALARLGALGPSGLDKTDLLKRLARIRAAVTSGAVNPQEIFGRYTALLRDILDMMVKLARQPESTVAKDDISAHTRLVAAKEYLGQMRATLGYWMEERRSDDNVHHSLIRLKSLYDEQLRMFRIEASPELLKAFDELSSTTDIQSALKVLAMAISKEHSPTNLSVETWWVTATKAVDQFKAIEDQSLLLIGNKAEAKVGELRRSISYRLVLAFTISVVIMALAVSAIVGLLRALDKVLTSMEIISKTQDFGNRIPVDSHDEIGRISRSFNQLLDIAHRLLVEKDYLATTDSLTGICNRFKFTSVLRAEIERKRRNKATMALILMDVDHFKRINDTFGHDTGDDVLKALTKIVTESIRAVDLFGRWGGEEFILLLRDEGCEAATALAEKLRVLIADHEFAKVGCMTCSFGLSVWRDDDTEASFIKRADEALYSAKGSGRNKVSCGLA